MSYAQKLMEAGIFTELYVEPGVPHAYEYLYWTPQAQRFFELRDHATARMLGAEKDMKESPEAQAFKELLEKDVVPTAIIVDPPRSGLDETTVNNLNKLKLEKLSYISCNPATLMRDLHMLEDTYTITSLTPVDNFCYSSSIETVATLERK